MIISYILLLFLTYSSSQEINNGYDINSRLIEDTPKVINVGTLEIINAGAFSKELCIEFCQNKTYCIANKDENNKCLVITDRNLLHMHLDELDKSNFKFDWNNGDILSFDNLTFELKTNYGLQTDDAFLPTDRLLNIDYKKPYNIPVQNTYTYGPISFNRYPYSDTTYQSGRSSQIFYNYPINAIQKISDISNFENTHRVAYTAINVKKEQHFLDPVFFFKKKAFHITATIYDVKHYLNCPEPEKQQPCWWNNASNLVWNYWQMWGLAVGIQGLKGDYNKTNPTFADSLKLNNDHCTYKNDYGFSVARQASPLDSKCGYQKWFHKDNKLSYYNEQTKKTQHLTERATMCENCPDTAHVVMEPVLESEVEFFALKFNTSSSKFIRFKDSLNTYQTDEIEQIFSIETFYTTQKCIQAFEKDEMGNWVLAGHVTSSTDETVVDTDPSICIDSETGHSLCRTLSVSPGPCKFDGETILTELENIRAGKNKDTGEDMLFIFPLSLEKKPTKVTYDFQFEWGLKNNLMCGAHKYVVAFDLSSIVCAELLDEFTLDSSKVEIKFNESRATTKCPDGHILVGINEHSMWCSKLTQVNLPVPPPAPSIPYVGALSTSRYTKNIKNNYKINYNTWQGTPIQSITINNDNSINLFHYDRICHQESMHQAFVESESKHFISQSGTYSCTRPNEFVTFVNCTTDDCKRGIEFFCVSAPNCATATEAYIAESSICSAGDAIVGFSCDDLNSAKICESLKPVCVQAFFDKNANHHKDKNELSVDEVFIDFIIGTAVVMLLASLYFCYTIEPSDNSNVKDRRSLDACYDDSEDERDKSTYFF